jgi:hypothetical protein
MDEIIESIGWSLESGTTYRIHLIVRMASKTHHMVQMKILTGGGRRGEVSRINTTSPKT